MRKKRGYNRDVPVELVKDYKLFAIACEGNKREPDYFNVFRHISKRIAVDIIEDVVSDEELEGQNSNKSAPKWVLDRAIRYIEKEGLSEEDELWFVMDVDRWDYQQLKEVADYCDKYPNWNIAISNSCFEVWLYFHKRDSFDKDKLSCSELKYLISTMEKGGYNAYKFIPYLNHAIVNAEKADNRPEHFMPSNNATKIYKLGNALLTIIGRNGFQNFIDNILPDLTKK